SMRFGISTTSLIDPKNFLTRLRPVNVCAIVLRLSRFVFGGQRGRLSGRPHPIATIRTGVGAVRFYVTRGLPEPPHALNFTVTRPCPFTIRLPRGPGLGANRPPHSPPVIPRARGPGIVIFCKSRALRPDRGFRSDKPCLLELNLGAD